MIFSTQQSSHIGHFRFIKYTQLIYFNNEGIETEKSSEFSLKIFIEFLLVIQLSAGLSKNKIYRFSFLLRRSFGGQSNKYNRVSKYVKQYDKYMKKIKE